VNNCSLESYLKLIEKNRGIDLTKKETAVKVVSAAKLPTRFGKFVALAFEQNKDNKEHAAFVVGDVIDKENVLVRLHSECLTGDAIGSLRCDCRDQLEGSMNIIQKEELGIILYLRQEGRGIGLTNKLKAYKLQDEGLNTVEANHALGFDDDERDYELAAKLLNALKIKSIRLMTNNPNKLNLLKLHGIKITERVEHIFEANEYNEFYLETKKTQSGHLINEIQVKQK
jgi:GTP cyclohydrolase II